MVASKIPDGNDSTDGLEEKDGNGHHPKRDKKMTRQADPHPSEKQLEVLNYLIGFVEQNGYQPSQGEMAEFFGVTKTAITQRLRDLASRGIIEIREGAKERAIKVNYVRFKAYYDKEP